MENGVGKDLGDRTEVRVFTAAITFIVLVALAFSIYAAADAATDDDGGGGGTVEAGSGATGDGPTIDLTSTHDEGFEARDPEAPATPTGTVHRITMVAREGKLEIAPGHEQTAWTFDGTIPGPVLRGKVGDTFEITLKNTGELGHSIDFHASKVAWNVEMRTIEPGEELLYRFTATNSGIFMYHCGTPPVIQHIGSGMYGAIIIDPPTLPPVDHEFVMVQSELYAATASEPPDLTKMLNEQWDAVVFNGYVNQYQAAPMRVEPSERVRVWVLDAGPSENSSFHVIGTIFDTVFKEGAYALRPGSPEQGGAQALDLQPAQGGFVEFTFAVPGLYPFVTHKFASASKGALGVFQAGEVADGGTAEH
jgi:nitrite reductase (NO-forming)